MLTSETEKGKKRKKPEKPQAVSNGWKKVDIGDELLLGSEEGGFLELEELSHDAIFSLDTAATDTTEQTAKAAASTAKPKKQKKGSTKDSSKQGVNESTEGVKVDKKRKKGAAKIGEAESGVDGLKAKIAALQQENAALKAESTPHPQKEKEKHIPADPNSARSRKIAAKKAKAKEVRTARKLAAKARKQRVAERAGQEGELAPAKKPKKSKPAKAGKPEPKEPPTSVGQAPKEGAPAAVNMLGWQGLGLGSRVIAAIATLGFEEPTPIQRECMQPAIRDRRDIIGAAQTGSGKTLAFGLPILQLLDAAAPAAGADAVTSEEPPTEGDPVNGEGQQTAAGLGQKPLRALILEPTRELAMQVCEHLQRVAKPLGVWVAPIVGGISPAKQARLLGRQPQVIVATPGRLWELMRLGEPHLADLSQVSFLVLDEADRMVQQGHFQELSNILESLASQRASSGAAIMDDGMEADMDDDAAPDDAGDADADPDDQADDASAGKATAGLLQTFVFSATLTLPEKLRKRLRRGGGASGSVMLDDLMDRLEFRGKPKIVDLTSQRKLADKVEEATLHCGDEERDELLYYILAAHPGRTLVFANAVSTARRIAALLHILKLPSAALHAGMQQRARLKALDRFKNNENAVLVASDVAARGLDITGVRCVIHYQIPASVDIYVHRSGRTARGDADGLAIALVAPKEAPRYAALQQALDRPEPSAFPLNAALLPSCRQRVKLAVRLDAILREQSKANAEKSWKQRNAEAMDMEVSSEDDDEDMPAAQKQKRHQQANDGSSAEDMLRELEDLLAQPLQASFSRRFFTGVSSASLVAKAPAKPHAATQPQASARSISAGVGAESEAAVEDVPDVMPDMDQQAAEQWVQQQQQQSEREQGLKQTVALAQKLASSRQLAKGKGKNGGSAPKKVASKGAVNKSKKELEQEALAAALQRRQRKRQKGGSMAIAALDRNTLGPDALAAVRQARLAVP